MSVQVRNMSFVVAGHRGAGDLLPENTLPSFAEAARLGVNELELDLRLSGDGHIVVIHDATVDRTTNGTGPVAELSLAELRELDAGDGQVIPTFAEVLEATDLTLQIEIKDPAVLGPLAELLAGRREQLSRLAPTSFDVGAVRRLRELLPELPTGLIHKVPSRDLLDRAEGLGVGRVLVGQAGLEPEFVREAHDRGFRVDMWPVHTAEDVRRAVELDVDGFTTDDPRIVAEAGYVLRDGRLLPV